MNPEFRRNIWTEVTTQRLIVVPLVFALLYYCLSMVSPEGAYLGTGFLGVGTLICLLGGSPLALNSVLDEQREHTWDNQRMSSLGAWPMSWGKIFGATIFPWYASGFCFLIYLFGFPSELRFDTQLKLVGLIILLAIFFHSVVFIFSLEISWSEARKFSGNHWIGILILLLASPASALFQPKTVSLIESNLIVWYSSSFPMINFILGSLIVFMLWGLFGAYRAMRMELLHRSPPWAWTVFLIFLMFYWNGFTWMAASMIQRMHADTPDDLGFRASLLVSFGIAISAAWALVLTEKKDIVQLRKLFSGQKLHSRFSRLPKWLASALLAIVLFLTLQLFPITADSKYGNITEGITFFSSSVLLFFLRDTFIVLWCHSTTKFKNRAGIASVLYVVLLYTLLPWFLTATAGVESVAWVIPTPFSSIKTLLVIVAQVLAAGLVFWKRWSKLSATVTASGKAVPVRA